MGLDIGQVFSSIKADVEKGMSDVVKMGSSALPAYLEDQAIKILQADKAQHEKDFSEKLGTLLKGPSSADSLGAYISNISQAPVLKEYGPYILGAIAVIALGAIFIGRK